MNTCTSSYQNDSKKPTIGIKARALRLLAGREYSRHELEKKLAVHEQAPGQLAAALDALEAKDFINPQRVAESVVNRRSAKLGSARIRQELQAKGLTADVVARALEPVKASEVARAQEVWRRKFGSPALDAAGQARHMRFLAGRGFPGEAIAQVVRKPGRVDS